MTSVTQVIRTGGAEIAVLRRGKAAQGKTRASAAKPLGVIKGGITVRTLGMVVGMAVWLLGISPPLWAQPAAGPITVTACAPCHSAGTAATQAAPNFPKLDGQHAAYLEKQLREYRSGKRKTQVMAPIIAALKKQQIPEMAKHFASQSPSRGTVQSSQLASAGKALYEQGNRATGVPGCVGCHLADGAGSERYPRLAGQSQAYIVQQLTEFKSGTRNNDRAHVMRAVAGRLTDEEMRAVAEYLAGM